MVKGYGKVIVACVLLSSCRDTVKLNGRFTGIDKQSVYLEKISPNSNGIVDSTMTDRKGNFSFDVKLPEGQPTIYNINYKGAIIPLLLSPKERVSVNSIGAMIQNYTVDGSQGSEQIRQINSILTSGAISLDSITNLYSRPEIDDSLRKTLTSDYARIYYKTKRDHIKFIVENVNSLSAVYALYQRLPNDNTLFNGDTDIVYYRMVADSVEVNYPNSPYLASLRKELAAADASQGMAELINKELAKESSYPDIDLPDMYGKRHRLSSNGGKLILVDFWSAAIPKSRAVNAELKEVYEQFNDQGFEIYQVAVDKDKATWVTVVQEQKLPWVSVCDFRGGDSPAVRSYNLGSIPANFLIDQKGTIVEKNLFGDELVRKINQYLK